MKPLAIALTPTTQNNLEANGLFGPKTLSDRALTVEERQGDFDRFLALAQKEALKWNKKAGLTSAQAKNVDAADKHGLQIEIAGNAIAFEEVKPGTSLKRTFIPASQALSTALATGKLTNLCSRPWPAVKRHCPLYLVDELKRKDNDYGYGCLNAAKAVELAR